MIHSGSSVVDCSETKRVQSPVPTLYVDDTRAHRTEESRHFEVQMQDQVSMALSQYAHDAWDPVYTLSMSGT